SPLRGWGSWLFNIPQYRYAHWGLLATPIFNSHLATPWHKIVFQQALINASALINYVELPIELFPFLT
ncbi:MAG: hypothetical protein LLF95_03510, partial [Bacteroidales bacterium]|nr:hypothetical protein [Bacteroidales bacterium]